MISKLETVLSNFTEEDWRKAVEELLPAIHEVDRNAVQIWFRFYPLELREYLADAEDQPAAIKELELQGDFDLATHIAGSHHFLYGHRYWKAVKCSVEKEAEEFNADDAKLTEIIKEVAIRVAEKKGIDRTLVNAIAAVGLATMRQVGLETFTAASDEIEEPKGLMARSPDAIVAERSKDDSQGMFGFLKTVDKKYSVRVLARDYEGKFSVLYDQEITHAAAQDKSQAWQEKDPRCWNGPVPVECIAATCGLCWVGVIGGQEKLSEVAPRERRAMKVFGYDQPEDEKPFLRLACQVRAYGNATLVVPPWNGTFGKKVRGDVEEVELEPNTTSAKRLREIVKEALSGE
ncbi:MAG: 2Fe-2S iron-sulfur cluster binding domain-containing protein [Chloracidobacterium sp.]|nr:2Fe-2S iron-sulfur cluster binding domain-containing protein [Chloracidobacterium sp.]MCC6824957.1 2Fe-2S iron-sulfur cluster binding domain-containing protein [Acidobacteriota bacterium]MCO5333228.1 2Fe-2S iron-sulfur cluster-binding protein [Pyrinomonadaceae bacterium]